MRRLLFCCLLPMWLAACATEAVYDSPEEVQRAIYTDDGPPKLTLITAINNRSGQGGHSALMISGAQRVLFDPAGSWHHPTVPERGDVLYGMTPLMLDFYTDFHARVTYHVVFQEIEVTPEIASKALALAEAHGPASKATCGLSVSGVLRQLGFTQVAKAWYPHRIMNDFANLPGVRERKVFDDSPDENELIRADQARVLAKDLAR